MDKKALKALEKVSFDAPKIDGEYLGGATGYPAPGAYRITSFECTAVSELKENTVGIRATYDTDGPNMVLEFPYSTEYEEYFDIGWKGIKGIFSVASMDDDAKETAIDAASNPGAQGNLAHCIAAIEEIDEVVIEISYPEAAKGYPTYRGLPLDTDTDEYVPAGLTAKEAAEARKAAKAARDAKQGGKASKAKGGKAKGKSKKRGGFDE